MVLIRWQHISQTQNLLMPQLLLLLVVLLLLLLRHQLLLSALVEKSEQLLEHVETDAANLCEHLCLVQREGLQTCSRRGAAESAT